MSLHSEHNHACHARIKNEIQFIFNRINLNRIKLRKNYESRILFILSSLLSHHSNAQ